MLLRLVGPVTCAAFRRRQFQVAVTSTPGPSASPQGALPPTLLVAWRPRFLSLPPASVCIHLCRTVDALMISRYRSCLSPSYIIAHIAIMCRPLTSRCPFAVTVARVGRVLIVQRTSKVRKFMGFHLNTPDRRRVPGRTLQARSQSSITDAHDIGCVIR